VLINGKLALVYTDHFEKIGDYESQIEIQNAAFTNDSIRTGSITTLIHDRPAESTRDIRDPKIWFDSKANC